MDLRSWERGMVNSVQFVLFKSFFKFESLIVRFKFPLGSNLRIHCENLLASLPKSLAASFHNISFKVESLKFSFKYKSFLVLITRSTMQENEALDIRILLQRLLKCGRVCWDNLVRKRFVNLETCKSCFYHECKNKFS